MNTRFCKPNYRLLHVCNKHPPMQYFFEKLCIFMYMHASMSNGVLLSTGNCYHLEFAFVHNLIV